VFNDIVSIILFNTVTNYKDDFELSFKTIATIAGDFIMLGLISMLIGLVAGIFSSLLFKKCRFLTHSAITETLLIVIIAFISYMISEATGESGIITLLTCGISMAHYTWYNLSP